MSLDVECRNCGHPMRLHQMSGDCTECATRCAHARTFVMLMYHPTTHPGSMVAPVSPTFLSPTFRRDRR